MASPLHTEHSATSGPESISFLLDLHGSLGAVAWQLVLYSQFVNIFWQPVYDKLAVNLKQGVCYLQKGRLNNMC